MDDNGNEPEFDGSMQFELTPRGWFQLMFQEIGYAADFADEEWHKFEAFCIRKIADNDEATHAALVFDGGGGQVVGITSVSEDRFE